MFLNKFSEYEFNKFQFIFFVYIFLASPFLILSQIEYTVYWDVNDENYSKDTLHNKNQVIRCKGLLLNKKKVGHWDYFSKNGFKEMQGSYSSGKREGEFKYFDENGKLIRLEKWQNGLPDGDFFYYHENGKIKASGAYIFDTDTAEYAIGYQNFKNEFKFQLKKSGLWTYYRNDGSLENEISYSNDVPNGIFRGYKENWNQISEEGTLKNGYRDGVWKYYHDGYLTHEITYIKNKSDGEYKEYYKSGKLQELKNYKSNILHGKYTSFYKSGNKKTSGNFINGKQDGIWEYYYESGFLAIVRSFKSGIRNGAWTAYYPNSNMKYRENYSNGYLISERESFYSNKIKKTIEYYRIPADAVSTKEDDIILEVEEKNYGYSVFKRDNEQDYKIRDKSWEYYFPNGKLKRKESYKDGHKSGLWVEYYSSGFKSKEETYINGQKNGLSQEYYDNGAIETQSFYYKGKLIDSLTKYPDQLYSQHSYDKKGIYGQKSNSPSIGDVIKVKFEGKNIEANLVCITTLINPEDADANPALNINQKLLGAEKEAQLLDVNFTMSDKPVTNDMFIFGIVTENAKKLTLEMFDDEGHTMVSNCTFDIKSGSSFNIIDFRVLENGDYSFRLTDDAGKELNRYITISKSKSFEK